MEVDVEPNATSLIIKALKESGCHELGSVSKQ